MEPLDPSLHADFMRLKLKGHWKLQLTHMELSCLQVTQPASEVVLPASSFCHCTWPDCVPLKCSPSLTLLPLCTA